MLCTRKGSKHQWNPHGIWRRLESQQAAWKVWLALEVPLNLWKEENLTSLLGGWVQNEQSPWYPLHGQLLPSVTDSQQEGTARKLRSKYLDQVHCGAELCAAETFSVYVFWKKSTWSTLSLISISPAASCLPPLTAIQKLISYKLRCK